MRDFTVYLVRAATFGALGVSIGFYIGVDLAYNQLTQDLPDIILQAGCFDPLYEKHSPVEPFIQVDRPMRHWRPSQDADTAHQ